VDETYVKVAGQWVDLYRAVDQRGQIIDVLVFERQDGLAAHALFTRAMRFGVTRLRSPPTGHRFTPG
jgi:transposase-like protein